MHQPTERVIRVLERVLASADGLRLTELSVDIGVPKSTLLPIVTTLCEHHYLHRSGEIYLPGIALYAMGNAEKERYSAMALVRRELEELSARFGETCYFGILEGGEVRYLDKVDSDQPLRVLTEIGTRLPAYATGLGKALLMGKSEPQIRALYPNGLRAITPHTVTDWGMLFAELTEAEQRGYAWECEESTAFIRCFAVPIRVEGRVTAAVSIAIPIFRYEENKRDGVIMALLESGARLSRLLETAARGGEIWS